MLTFTMPICNLHDITNFLGKGQCLLGIDPGSVVIGLAISDPSLSVASPLMSLSRTKWETVREKILTIVTERSIGGFVIGLPKLMSGKEGPQAQAVRSFGRNLMTVDRLRDLPLIYWDERLSTAAVERFLLEDNMSRKRRDEVIDKAAAAYILQGALDALKVNRRGEE